MKFYLSSYKFGQEVEKLKEFAYGKKIGLIGNAIDYLGLSERKEKNERGRSELNDIGVVAEMLDLQEFFGKQDQLMEKINNLDGVWVRGGNTFVLRQAFYMSGFDEIIKNIQRDDFVYAGYSAGICILAPRLDPLHDVDDPTLMPYKQFKKVIWEGLDILDYIILPHYKSDHPESTNIDKVVENCKKNNIPYKTLRDGEVIIIE